MNFEAEISENFAFQRRMAEEYAANSQFIVLLNEGDRRWFGAKTVLLLTVIALPVVVFCGIYTLILSSTEKVIFPKSSHFQVPNSWIHRAKTYSDYPNVTYNNFFRIVEPRQEIDEFKLVCYYNFPNENSAALEPAKIDPFLCTHINVGFASVKNNTLSLDDFQLSILRSVIDLKQTNNKLKVLVSVGGAGNDDGFSQMVLTHNTRKMFIRSVLDCVKFDRIDGVDLDWEFPNRDPDGDKHQRMHFTQLLEEFRAAINKQSKHKFLVTLAAAAPNFIIDDSYDVPYINQFVDFVNLMSYDYHFYARLTPFTGHNSPLFQSSGEKGYFTTLNINYSANYWNAKGLERKKLVIGLPTYGHSFQLMNMRNNGLYAPARGYGKLGSNGFVDYGQICKFLDVNRISPVFDLDAKSPYATKSAEWLAFDNEQSLSFKAEFIRDHQFAGAMVYSLNTDDYAGVCKLDKRVEAQVFPLTKKVREILDPNYSIL